MNISTASKPNARPYLSLSADSVSKNCTFLKDPELSEDNKARIKAESIQAIHRISPELTFRIHEVSSIKKGKLFHFIGSHRKDLSYLAIKRPSDWLLFSQHMLHKFNTDCRIARLLKKLNYLVKDFDRSQCNKGVQKDFTDGTFNQIFPRELRRQIALDIAPSYDDTSTTLEKMRLILLDDKPPPSDCFSQIKSIPIQDLAYWIKTHQVALQTLKIATEKLNLILPKLDCVNLSDYSKEKIPHVLLKLKKARHLICNNLSDEDLKNLIDLKNLTSLDLSDSNQISIEGLQFLQDVMPELIIRHTAISV